MAGLKRLRIGILVGGIADDFSMQLSLGAMRAAKKEDVDLFVLPGRYIERDYIERDDLAFEYQYNTLFSYPNHENIDGVIIAAGSIGYYASLEKTVNFIDGFSKIPNVVVAMHDENHCCVRYDNKSAVKEGVTKLIKECGCRKICILSGPDGNTDALEREEAFLSALNEAGVSFSEKQKQAGDLTYSDMTAAAMEELIQNNPDMDGLFCVNDDTAIKAYEILEKHGRVVGKDIYVMGFDNVSSSAKMDPPLTTVAANPLRLGAKAVEVLLRKIRGEKSTGDVVPARLIVRESFGKIKGKDTGDLDVNDFLNDDYFESVFYRFLNESDSDSIKNVYDIFRGIMEKALELGRAKEPDMEKLESLYEAFDNLFHTDAIEYMDVDMMTRYIELVYKIAASGNYGVSKYNRKISEMAQNTYFLLINGVNKLINSLVKNQEVEDISIKNFVRKTMSFHDGSDESYKVFLNYFDWLSIKNASIYTFEKPVLHTNGEEYIPAQKFIKKAVLRSGKVTVLPQNRCEVELKDIFDNTDFDVPQLNAVLLPMFFAEELYGFVIFELNRKLFGKAEFVASQLGAATHILMMLRENEKITNELEKNLDIMEQMNVELDRLSRIDQLTGLYNRRGFVEKGEKYLAQNVGIGNVCSIGFVDMNNLKIVNDKFGHEEGDFSLKKIADALLAVLGKDAIIGRIGGDEFAFVAEEKRALSVIDVRKEVDGFLREFNTTSDKPYNISVSIGMIKNGEADVDNLELALASADKMLYDAKKHKDTNAIK